MLRPPSLALALALLGIAARERNLAAAQAPAPPAAGDKPRGLVTKSDEACPGYTLISPFSHGLASLLDLEGRVVHQWKSRYDPGLAPYLLPDGRLLRGIALDAKVPFHGGGQAGGVQMFSWEGELLWEFHLASDVALHHHDIEPLPNGNVLMIGWEAKSVAEVRAAGRLPSCIGDEGLWPCMIVEVEPLPPYGARVVWEWHVWDHLIQDLDAEGENYGVVSRHPGRVNINGDIPRSGAPDESLSDAERARMQALGYLADDQDLDDAEKRRRKRADWLHLNAIDYHTGLDQIAVSVWQMSEIWILDHSTTTAEARGSTGGRSGRGGDLLYRWGNPQIWQMGSAADRQLFFQHDVQWIPEGSPGAGRLTIFNNGRTRPGGERSTVIEIEPPLQPDGSYAREEGEPFGPGEPCWVHDPPESERFYASFISGAQRLPNGNTLICDGPDGRLFEVTAAGKVVWDYRNPFGEVREGGRADLVHGLFRATRIPPDHPALAGRALAPLDPQPRTTEQIEAERRAKAAPQASGWQPLFDEKLGLSRWTAVNVAERSTFTVRPDPDDAASTILHCTGKPTGILRSDRMYENFLCELEWRHMSDGGNAGFFVWADPLPAAGGPFTRGIEVQVCNLGNGDWFTSHGDIFPIWGAAMTPDPRFRISGSRSMPKEDAFHARKTGEWNHYRITCVDGSITLEVNGHLVTAGSRCSPSKGYLCLESEGGEVHFRKLRIWELPPGSTPAGADRTAREATRHATLYNGLDLGGWTVRSGEWRAEDWRLVCAAGEAAIERPLPPRTRSLFLDFKRAAAPPSGALPFRLGDQLFELPGEKPGEWNRAQVTLLDDRVDVELQGATRSFPRPGRSAAPALVLCNDGAPTEYCSLFAAGG